MSRQFHALLRGHVMIKRLLLALSAITLHCDLNAQTRQPLFTEAGNRVLLEMDSVNSDSFPVMRFITVTVGPAGGVLRTRRYELDCEILRGRSQIGQRWLLWQTAIGPVFQAAYKHVCVDWPTPERWTYMFDAQNGMYLIDRATVDTFPRMRSVRRVWLKLQNDSAELDVTTRKKFDHVLSRYDIDCGERRMRTLATIQYDSAGKVIDSREILADSAKWSSIIPDSNGETMATWVCNTLQRIDKFLPVKRR
jgi:surface-adhesin protein E